MKLRLALMSTAFLLLPVVAQADTDNNLVAMQETLQKYASALVQVQVQMEELTLKLNTAMQKCGDRCTPAASVPSLPHTKVK